MTKLVEEFIISSEVLANALVKARVVDETFTEGTVAHIEAYEDGFGRVDTYSIKIEKEVSLKDIKCSYPTHTCGYENGDNEGRPIDEEKKEDAPQFVSPLEFTLNLIANLNEQASKDDDAKKFATEFIKRVNSVKGDF